MKQVYDDETEEILKIARECVSLPGDFVELGCYDGETSLKLAEIVDSKRLWIYDSFEGLPEKTEKDISTAGIDFKKGELTVSKREVKARFLRANLKVPNIIKGWFSDLDKEKDLPQKIAFAFLDGDFYESIRDSLNLIDGKMVKDGIIIIHDYNNPELPGVTKAIEEWNKNYNIIQKHSLAIIRI